jgi:regulator of nonsense transcripts 1
MRCLTDILAVTRVVCATCIGAGHDLLAAHRFPLVLIDEATQATEPAVLCPIVKASEQVVLLGDHFQLPPTVMSDKAAQGTPPSLLVSFAWKQSPYC